MHICWLVLVVFLILELGGSVSLFVQVVHISLTFFAYPKTKILLSCPKWFGLVRMHGIPNLATNKPVLNIVKSMYVIRSFTPLFI